MKGRIACRAVIEVWTIPFAADTAAETPNAVQWSEQPAICLLTVGESRPHLHGSFGYHESDPNGISIGSAVCAGLTNVTDRQTNRHTVQLRL